ncbi:MAG: PD-(D/E)XK nuclease family protein [Bacteroidota bacterium]|nr:PD-(D/E)XK nuclease family protein [Bacteroidota bacterium]MDE2644400.1 PD-(D/E)XK nuclease family protein [Bacteroidota bacterium]
MMIIAATERLARARQQEYDWHQQELGHQTWPTAPVKTLNAWMSELWEEGMYLRSNPPFLRPLRPAEEQIIWEDILRSQARHLPLDVSATAELARNSWKLLCDWRLPLEGTDWNSSEDSRTFQKWALEFRTRCDRNGWFSAAELSKHVARIVNEGQIEIPPELELCGFLEPIPAHEQFFEALRKRGTRIQETPLPNHAEKSFRLGASDTFREIRVAAEWARRILQNDLEAERRSFRIGIIVPGIGNLRSHVERVFSEVFHPQAWLHPEQDSKRLFNISLGLPAGDYPIIQSALQILSIEPREIPIEEASRLLLSPFLPGFAEERTSRALLDVALRNRGEQYVTLRDLIYLAKKEHSLHHCPLLASLFVAWQTQYSDLGGRKKPSEWAEALSQLLQSKIQDNDGDASTKSQSISWPGTWQSVSAEYQTYSVWEELVSALVELDGVCGSITRQRAVTILRRMASSKLFQPERDPAPVQILGVLEAMGLSFDYLWMIGMHDDAWPPSCEPAPFVPIRLQRRKGLWRSTPEGMLQHAQTLADRLLKSAPMVVVSHPRREGDADRRVSPLFAELPEVSEEDLGVSTIQSLGEWFQRSSKMEIIEDHQGIPFAEGKVSGGTSLFKLQAACPFRAFAELRLGATMPGIAQPGLDAQDRGRVMHRILDILWRRLGTQAALQALSEREEADLVRGIVREELDRLTSYRQGLRNERFLRVEQARLEKIIGEWLVLERERKPFTVLEQEKRQDVTVGGIDISGTDADLDENESEVGQDVTVAGIDIRIQEDRVDLLEGGERFILDYKTGICSVSLWDGERPDDPQLPIYAVVADSPIAGISFGSLMMGDVKFKGIANQDIGNKGVRVSKEPLPELIGRWRETLNALGRDYKAGHAIVDPKIPGQTCRYCNLTTFCRVGSAPVKSSREDE